MKRIFGALLPFALIACSGNPAKPPDGATPAAGRITYDEVAAGLRAEEDCGRYLQPASELAGSEKFRARESTERQLEFLRLIAACAAESDQYQLSYDQAERAAALDSEVVWPQVMLLYFGTWLGHADSSLAALNTLAKIAPDNVRGMDLESVNTILRAAREADDGGDRELRAYEALEQAGYVPPAPYYPDFLRMDHARLLLERDRVAEARRRLVGIVDIDYVVEMRVDRRFDVLRGDPAFDAQLDVATAVKRDIARSRGAMQANPRLMEAVYVHAMVLLKAMRDQEGLAVVDAALGRDDADRTAYTDRDDYRNWLTNVRGYFLYNLGRVDEGRAALQEAAGLQERGEPNVSNIINYGGFLVLEGRAQEALDLVPRIGEPSPYGRCWIESIKACSAVQLRDEELQRASLDYLKAHEADNPAALSRTLICMDDMDAAAALMIRRLEAPKTRADALRALQITPAASDAGLPYRKLLNERYALLRERADVRAAAEKVGRIETLPVGLGGD